MQDQVLAEISMSQGLQPKDSGPQTKSKVLEAQTIGAQIRGRGAVRARGNPRGRGNFRGGIEGFQREQGQSAARRALHSDDNGYPQEET